MKKKITMISVAVIFISIIYIVVSRNAPLDNSKQLKFGATYMTMDNPYFAILDENIKEVVESNGDILITRDPLNDQDKQNEQIRNMIDEGIDVLFLNPVNWKAVRPAIRNCEKHGVTIIVVDTNIYEEEKMI
jgi:ribose transport system substrate-binding protein